MTTSAPERPDSLIETNPRLQMHEEFTNLIEGLEQNDTSLPDEARKALDIASNLLKDLPARETVEDERKEGDEYIAELISKQDQTIEGLRGLVEGLIESGNEDKQDANLDPSGAREFMKTLPWPERIDQRHFDAFMRGAPQHQEFDEYGNVMEPDSSMDEKNDEKVV